MQIIKYENFAHKPKRTSTIRIVEVKRKKKDENNNIQNDKNIATCENDLQVQH